MYLLLRLFCRSFPSPVVCRAAGILRLRRAGRAASLRMTNYETVMLSGAGAERSGAPAQSSIPAAIPNAEGVPLHCDTYHSLGCASPQSSLDARSTLLLRLYHGKPDGDFVRRIQRQSSQARVPAQVSSLRRIHCTIRCGSIVALGILRRCAQGAGTGEAIERMVSREEDRVV